MYIKNIDIDKIIIPKDRIRVKQEKQEEFDRLKDSIKKLGLIHPILINQDYQLIAGYRRLTAFKELAQDDPQFQTIRCSIVDYREEKLELEAELQENTVRKNLAGWEVSAALSRLKELYEQDHPETKQGAKLTPKESEADKRLKNLEISKEVDTGSTSNASSENETDEGEPEAERFTKVYSDMLGTSERTIRRKTRIGDAVRKGEVDEETTDKYKKGEITDKKMRQYLRGKEIAKKRRAETLKYLEEEKKKEEESEVQRKMEESFQEQVEKRKEKIENIPEPEPKEEKEPKSKIYNAAFSVDGSNRQVHQNMLHEEVQEWVLQILFNKKLWREIKDFSSLDLHVERD